MLLFVMKVSNAGKREVMKVDGPWSDLMENNSLGRCFEHGVHDDEPS